MILIISYDQNFFSKNSESVLDRHILYHEQSKNIHSTEVFVVVLSKYKLNYNNQYYFIKNIFCKNIIIRYIYLFKYIYINKNILRAISSQKFGASATLLIILSKFLGIKYYLQIHTYFISKKYIFGGIKNLINVFFCIFNIYCSDKIRVVSNNIKEILEKQYTGKNFYSIPVPTINNVILNNSKKEYDLIFIGRLSKEKNPYLFLDIIKNTNYKGILIGDGPLKNEIINSDNSGQIRYIQSIPEYEVTKYISKSKLLIITSKFEGLSRVGIQAISVGTPVITTNCKGVNDYIVDGVNGFIINDDTAETFINKIDFLLSNIIEYNKFSKKSLNISKNYDYNSIVLKMVNFLND